MALGQLVNDRNDGALRTLTAERLNLTRYAILAKLHQQKDVPMSLTQLADALHLDRTTIAAHAKALAKDKFIRNRKSATDARARDLTITKPGAGMLYVASQSIRRTQTRILALIPKDDGAWLMQYLLNLEQAIVDDDQHGGTSTPLA